MEVVHGSEQGLQEGLSEKALKSAGRTPPYPPDMELLEKENPGFKAHKSILGTC